MRKRAPTFEQTTPVAFGPQECRHITSKRAEPFRQCWYWSAQNGPDVLGTTRMHVVLCVKCWRVLSDVADFGGDE